MNKPHYEKVNAGHIILVLLAIKEISDIAAYLI